VLKTLIILLQVGFISDFVPDCPFKLFFSILGIKFSECKDENCMKHISILTGFSVISEIMIDDFGLY